MTTQRKQGQWLIKHGQSLNNRKTPEYQTWQGMKARCLNPNGRSYRLYGGRGIKVCREWLDSFEAFFTAMGPRPSPDHSLDRIDNDGDYRPSNCRWATGKEQQNNMRRNRWIEFGGKKRTLKQCSEETGIHHRTIQGRLNRGWPLARALGQIADKSIQDRSKTNAKLVKHPEFYTKLKP
jgi:hypothetical protein